MTDPGPAPLSLTAPSYFEENYTDYLAENPERKLRFYFEAVKRHAHGLRSIFEIGVGKGLFLEYARSRGFDVRGCDVNAEGVREARERSPDADIRLGEFEAVGCRTCQIVAAFDVVEHVPDVRRLFSTVFARLQPGGIFCFVCPVVDGPLGVVCRILDKDPTHVHMTSRAAWLHLARSTGFEVVDWTGILRYLLPRKHYIHREMPGVARYLSPAIMVVCAKSEVAGSGPRSRSG